MKPKLNYLPFLALGVVFFPLGITFLLLGMGVAGQPLFWILGLSFLGLGLTYLLVGIIGYVQQKLR